MCFLFVWRNLDQLWYGTDLFVQFYRKINTVLETILAFKQGKLIDSSLVSSDATISRDQ